MADDAEIRRELHKKIGQRGCRAVWLNQWLCTMAIKARLTGRWTISRPAIILVPGDARLAFERQWRRADRPAPLCQDEATLATWMEGASAVDIVAVSRELKEIIERQVAAGHAATESDFLTEAVQRYAQALDVDDEEIVCAADQGIADIDAGRFETIASADDMCRLRAELDARLDRLLTAQREAHE